MTYTTGYLIPFANRSLPVCKACADALGWFPLGLYRGTVELVHDGRKKGTQYECSGCKRLFRGGEKR